MPGEFVITELRAEGSGGTTTPLVFTWTNTQRSAPRGSWRFGLEQRSVREDYPGAARPIEQILGANFTEFQLTGVWDDRYNEPGYATRTHRDFETLVARGALCRFEYGTLSITGLLKNATFDYKRADYIGYEFTVSPHYRQDGDLASVGGGRKLPTAALRPVTEFRDLVNDQRDAMAVVMAGGPFNDMPADLTATTKGRMVEIDSAAQNVADAVQQGVQNNVERFDTLRRLAGVFGVLKGKAAALLTDIAVAKSDTKLAYANAKIILEFDVWLRGLSQYARAMLLTSYEAELEMNRRVVPRAMAIYYPHKGESLYSVSLRFYGTPGGWRRIAVRNSLTTMTLQGTEALIIPERG